jgi:hypothetical protein
LFCWSLNLGIYFLHFPLVPALIYYWVENGFHPFFVIPSFHLVLLLSLYCWSVSPRQVKRWWLVAWDPFWFLSVMWHGEALCRLVVQGVWILLLLGGFSCQVWLQCLSKIFALWSSYYLLSPSSCHLGFPPFCLFSYDLQKWQNATWESSLCIIYSCTLKT